MVGECGTKRAVTVRRPRPPLNAGTLKELALAYVGRFATTRARLARYLAGKLRERGWEGDQEPDIAGIVEHCGRLGFVDDAAFALSKARSLTGRGYGSGRVRQSLRAAGVTDEDAQPARELADQEAVEAALRLARRKRIGPYAPAPMEREAREKALAAMIRGGHSFGLARAIVALGPGAKLDLDALAAAAGVIID
jgi:regulatory protein